MRQSKNYIVLGIILILLGLIFLLHNLEIFWWDWGQLWPLFLLLPGLYFWIRWFQEKENFRLLMPGTILLVYGGYFMLQQWTDYFWTGRYWPVFILGPGLGFLAMYFLGNHHPGHLRSGTILVAISVFFFALAEHENLFWPLLFIVIGIALLIKGWLRHQEA